MLATKKILPQYITNSKGKKTSVILKVSDYENLLEDIEDLAVIAERKNESTITHEDFVKELKSNGLL